MKIVFLSLILCFPMWAGAQLKVPPLVDPVVDQAGLINSSDRETLREMIRDFHQRGKGQIQVLTLKDLGGVPIEQASIQITDQWKLGDKKRDDGVLILIAAQEHKIRIEVGQGLEGVIPDIKAKHIISDVMSPAFREESPSRGILIGTYQVMKTIDPSYEPGNAPVEDTGSSIFDRYQGLFILLFVIFIIFTNIFRPRRRSFWGGYGGWGGGGFGGGFGGGGFGGGSGGG